MTPQEKAEELVTRFQQSGYETGYNDVRDVHAAIRCSLIAVDEVQQLIKDLSSCKNRFIYIIDEMNYWEEVKQEIEKL
jgi:lysyl-tRNA synthetase class I